MKFISTKSVRLILITAHFMFRHIWELTNGLIPFKNSIKNRYIFHVFYFYFFSNLLVANWRHLSKF